MPVPTPKLGFLGGGMMAEALIGGILKKKLFPASNMLVSDVTEARLQYLKEKYAVNVCLADNEKVVRGSDIILIAVKPQGFAQLCSEVKMGTEKGPYGKGKVFVSIMAGVTLETLVANLGAHGEIIRVMPNTPALVNAAASAYAVNPFTDESAKPLIPVVESIFNAIGLCCELPSEAYMDAVTGLSGSGPAYVYMLIEALSDGGVKKGLQRPLAMKLAAQTVMGAAKMVIERGEHPAVLKNQVESPAGTTIAGTSALEEHGFRNAVISAVSAATDRSVELGKKK